MVAYAGKDWWTAAQQCQKWEIGICIYSEENMTRLEKGALGRCAFPCSMLRLSSAGGHEVCGLLKAHDRRGKEGAACPYALVTRWIALSAGVGRKALLDR